MSAFLAILFALAQDNSYLEIPMEGRFGDEITATGLETALKTAECLGAKHVVFTINSKGGDQIAARDVYNVLRKYEKAFRFHALIRQATGVALAPVVWCDTIFIRPGGIIGGLNLVIDEARYPGMEAGVVLMNLALNAGEEAARHGRSAELVRAMIDPGQAVNGWRDSAGRVQISPWVPNDIHSADFIVQHPAGTVLTLTERQAAELRFARPYDGDVAALGRELGFPHWIAQGDAGRVAMTEAMKAEQFKAGAAADDRRQFLIDLNRRRRTAAKGSIERFLNLANEWNPKLGTYSTYKQTSRWWDSYWDGCGYDTGRLTPESRRKWRDRSDVTVAALSKARGGVLEMKYLEKEARELGQDLLYPEGRLEEMRLDLELKIALLIRERDKRFKDD